MSTPQVVLVRQTDLPGPSFSFNGTTKKFSINPVSSDASNVLTTGADGLAALTPANVQANQITYTAALDTSTASNPKITLYKTVGGTTSVVSAIPTSSFDATVTGGSFNSTSGVLTLTESNTGSTIAINLGAYLTSLAEANSNSISLSGSGAAGSPLTATLVVDSITGNLLKVTASGTKVDPSDVLALLNANISHSLAVDTTNGLLKSVVNGVSAQLNIVQFVGVDGSSLGYALAGN